MKETLQLRKPKRFQKKHSKGLLYSSRGLLLYILPLPLIAATVLSLAYGQLTSILINVTGCLAFLFAAMLLRKGIAAEKHYLDKKITQPPKWPLKTLASLLVGLTTIWIAYLGAGHTLMVAIVFGIGAMVGMILLYGSDPRQEKMVAGTHGYSAEEISQTIDDAEKQIIGIEQANKQISSRHFNQRISTICQHAREVLEMLEDDPGDIRRARKFLNIYLDGALKVTEGYAKMQNKQQSEQLAQNFENVLQRIESVFIEQKQKLLEDDVLDLDVQIEVLTAQLKLEGVI